uniref:Uncharacterized protein n=1 Tax=Strigamia maritima TaxID=126957 RepID=T1IKJ7_STRMM
MDKHNTKNKTFWIYKQHSMNVHTGTIWKMKKLSNLQPLPGCHFTIYSTQFITVKANEAILTMVSLLNFDQWEADYAYAVIYLVHVLIPCSSLCLIVQSAAELKISLDVRSNQHNKHTCRRNHWIETSLKPKNPKILQFFEENEETIAKRPTI